MNRRVFVSALVALAATLGLSSPVAAQDMTGTWEITSEGRRGAQTMTLELVQDGSELTGTITMRMGGRRGGGGGGGGGMREIEITDGEIDGASFSFTMAIDMGGNSFSQHFSGTMDGDEISGTIEGGRGGGRPFTGKRAG